MNIGRVISQAALGAVVSGAFACSAAAGPDFSRSRPSETAAMASSAKGDNWIAANQFERAVAANDSPTNRFNLAVAYELTGRPSEAASLYRAILRSPSGAAEPRPIDAERNGDAASTAMIHTSRQHLARIDARQGEPAPGGFEVGASASAFVGGPSSGRVSNADARRLDEEARFAIGE